LLPGTTPADIAKARAELDRKRSMDALFDFQMPFRRAALAARLGSAMPLTAEQYVEFGAAVPEGYTCRSEATVAPSTQAEGKAKWEQAEAERKAAMPPRGPQTLREAQEAWPNGGTAFNNWVDSHQHIVNRQML
jgi:hypothetical protein